MNFDPNRHRLVAGIVYAVGSPRVSEDGRLVIEGRRVGVLKSRRAADGDGSENVVVLDVAE